MLELFPLIPKVEEVLPLSAMVKTLLFMNVCLVGLLITPLLASGNGRESSLAEFLDGNTMVSTRTNISKETSTIQIQKPTVKVTPAKSTSGREKLRISSLVFKSKNTIHSDISVDGHSKLIIGGISLHLRKNSNRETFGNNHLSSISDGTWLAPPTNDMGLLQCGVAADQLEEDYYSAIMSACAYENHQACQKYIQELVIEGGWKEVERVDLGYIESVIYKNDGRITVAFRGTESYETTGGIIDWGDNMTGKGRPISQAIIFAYVYQVIGKYGCSNLSFTGHSKGGGEALMAMKYAESLGCRADAVVFDERPEDNTEAYYDTGQARSYAINGEALDLIRKGVRLLLPGRRSGGGDSDGTHYLHPPTGQEDSSMIDRHDITMMLEAMNNCRSGNAQVITAGGGGNW